jgi:glycosyltransferase involved in cell wall biosynthesis
MRILHFSADYPDPLVPAKTRAVANLLALADGHQHRVLSLNRIGGQIGGRIGGLVGWAADIHALDFADGAGTAHRAVAYGAPGKGLLLKRSMERLADWAAADCAAAGFAPDLVHAHKLSVEGIAGARLAADLRVPLALSVQGNTDLKIVGARRDLRPLYARIWRQAAVVFPFAPWARARLDALLGARVGRTEALPCPGPADALTAPRASDAPVIRTAFNLKDAANKNAARLIRALARAAAEVPEIRLEIIGGGDAAAFAALAGLAAEAAPGRVRFLGAVPNAEVQRLFNAATAFALVSHRESFGMVFAEALLAGAPCLIPRGRAIEGYFIDGSVVLAADPGDEAGIARGLVRLVREEAAFKARLAELGRSGGLALLTRPAIRASYLGALEEITR